MKRTAEVALRTGHQLRDELGSAADLLAAAYPPQAIRMDRPYLDWILADLPPHRGPAGAMAWRDGELVGFAGAAPAMFSLTGEAQPGWIVSWVAVHPSARGAGLAASLYRVLLEYLAREAPAVVHTFAQHGTRGAALIEHCYAEAGWHGRELAPLEAHGALRRRLREPDTGGLESADRTSDIVLTPDRDFHRKLAEDPRLAVDAEGGARLVTVAFNDPDQAPIGTIELLAPDPAPSLLVEAVQAGRSGFPEAVDRLVIANLPPSIAATATAIGFRRLPVPAWRNWVFSRHAAHPVLDATRTAIPII